MHADMPSHTHQQLGLAESTPAASIHQDLAQLQEPLWLYMLPHLSAMQITALRSTCHAQRCMVDSTPRGVMEPVLGCMLAPSILKHAPPGADLQQLLRQQHTFLQNARSVPTSHTQRAALSADAHNLSISWAPRLFCDTLFIDFKPESSLSGRQLEGGPLVVFQSSLALSEDMPQSYSYGALPSSPHVTSWICWCTGSQDFACRSSLNGCHDVVVVDAVSGKLSSKVRVSQGGPAPMIHPSPNGTMLLVHPVLRAPTLHASVIGLTLPDLHISFHLDPPLQPARASSSAGNSSNAGAGSAARVSCSDIRPAWCGWSPTNAHFAIAWHAKDVSAHILYALAIHATTNGQMLRRVEVNSHSGSRGLLSPYFMVSWSPTGAHILVHAADAWDAWDEEMAPHCLVDLQGRCEVLSIAKPDDVPDPALRSDATWSPCGNYLHVCDLMLSGSACACFNYLWDARERKKVFQWRSAGNFYGKVVWASSSSLCFIQDLEMILAFPLRPAGGDDLVDVVVMYADGFRRCKGTCEDVAISPRGKFLVSRLFDTSTTDKASERLYHGAISLGGGACHMRLAPSIGHTLKGPICWHPCPMFEHICVLPGEAGAILLIDMRSGDLLWSCLELRNDFTIIKATINLSWAPDGSKLVAAESSDGGSIVALHFDR